MNSLSNLPLVSIVIATYNGELFLRSQLNSVIQQTYPNLEIIAVDDCSSDTTFDILKEYQNKHKNVWVYRNEKNIGLIKNFEKGILLSRGDYIAICDQDDIWYPHKIALMMSEIGDCCMAYCDSELIDNNGSILNQKLSNFKNYKTYTDAVSFLITNSIYGHAMIFTRQLAENAIPFPAEFVYDWWLTFNAILISRIKYLDQPLVKYRQHFDSFIGAIKISGKEKKIINKKEERKNIRKRVELFYEKCPAKNRELKMLLAQLNKSYKNFSLQRNYLRLIIFLKYYDRLLALKKRSDLRKKLFCLKMFFKIV